MNQPKTPPPPKLRLVSATNASVNSIPDAEIQSIITRLQQNLSQRHCVKELAAELQMSPRQFERRFKDETRHSLREYLKKIRLEKAQELLATTRLSIKEVGAAVGLEEISHFVRDFEAVFGLTPVHYHKRMFGKWCDVAFR
jgi:transcriptional regulator GlxA family with amidase domain